MENYCRMCLKEQNQEKFLNYSHVSGGKNIEFIYELFTSIKLNSIKEQENSKICPNCLQKLISFEMDRSKAIRCNDILTNWLDNGNKCNSLNISLIYLFIN